MVLCPSCGQKLPDDAKFCSKCAAPINLGGVSSELVITGRILVMIRTLHPLGLNTTAACSSHGHLQVNGGRSTIL